MTLPASTFFVCGCPKSGTTWVQLLLHHHPEISCAGESQLVLLIEKISRLIEDHNGHQQRRNTAIFGGIAGYLPFPEIGIDDERRLYRTLIMQMLDKTVHKAGVRAVGEKTPNLAEHLAWFESVMPQAKFIHVIRDGRDVAVSGWHHLHRDVPDETTMRLAFPDYALLSAQVWSSVIARARAAAAAMDGRYLEIRYEDLQRAPDAALDRLLGFLGVASSAERRRACIERASFETLTGGRPAGREDTRAFLRKGIAGDWRNWFDATLNQRFVDVAGPLLSDLGYATAP